MLPQVYFVGKMESLITGDDPRVTNHLDLSALPSRLLRWCSLKKLSTLLTMMLITALLLFGVAGAWPQKYASYGGGGPGPDGKYTLYAPGIRAKFIPYGASISNLFINDTNGLSFDEVRCQLC